MQNTRFSDLGQNVSWFQRISHSHRGFAGVLCFPRYFPRALVLYGTPKLFFPLLRFLWATDIPLGPAVSALFSAGYWLMINKWGSGGHISIECSKTPQEPGPCSPDLGLYYWVSPLLSNNKYLTCLPVHRLENVQLHRGSQHTYTGMKNSTVWWIFPRLWNTRDATRRGSLWFCHLLIARQKNTSLFIHVPFETAKSSCCLTTLRITYAKRCQKRLTFGFAPYKMLSLPALSW